MQKKLSQDQLDLKERIQAVLYSKKKSITDIAKDESDRVILGRHINGDTTPVSLSTVMRILYMFHDIDANWLIFGEGSMKKADHRGPHIYNNNSVNGSTAGGSINVGTQTIPYPVQQLLEEKDKQIAELKKDKERLGTIIDAMTVGARKS